MQKLSILLCSLLLAASAWAGSKADPGKQAIVLEEFVFMKSPTRDCHASSIMELSDGTLLCTWFGGTRERAKDVKIWLARKPKGGTWQEPTAKAVRCSIRCWCSSREATYRYIISVRR